MSRKRKKPGKSRQNERVLSPEIRAKEASQCLKTGSYREAITHYKELLKLERRPDWVASLAEAYEGRAQALAEKGMFKEAATIWRNRAEGCSLPLSHPRFFRLLLASGQIGQAVELLQKTRTDLEGRGRLPELREQFAALAVAGAPEVLEGWPPDDALCRDYPAAQGALEAYCGGDEERLNTYLQALPFRSPFRDLCQILKALRCFGNDAAAAAGILSRIRDSSPFAALARAAETALLPEESLIFRLHELSRESRSLVAALKGWPAGMSAFCNELDQLGSEPAPEPLLRFLGRHKKELGEAFIKEAGLRILIHHPKGRPLFTRNCGKLTHFERARIEALSLEEEKAHPMEIIECWDEAVAALDKAGSKPSPEQALSAALILDRMAQQMERLPRSEPHIIPFLERGLEFDPEDRERYVRLISLHRNGGRLKEARRWLEQAMARFPEDTVVLEEAVETALAGNAHKKAAGLAARILEKDPINQRVRNALVDAHLSHARKQIGQSKLELAVKELETAAGWARNEDALGRVELLQGVLQLTCGDRNQAEFLLKSGEHRCGGGLTGRFHLLLELAHIGRHAPTVIKLAGLQNPDGTPSPEDILQLANLLNDRLQSEKQQVAVALEHLMAPLRRAAKGCFHISEMNLICETWGRFGQHDLRSRFAKAALKHWKNEPIFIYHQSAAEIEQRGRLERRAFEKLDRALERAHATGDMATAERIHTLISEHNPFAPPPGFYEDPDFEDSDFPDEPDLEQMLEIMMRSDAPPEIRELKKQLGEEGLRALLEQFLTENSEMDGEAFPFEDSAFDPFAPAPKRRKKGAKKGREKAKSTHSDQLDLF